MKNRIGRRMCALVLTICMMLFCLPISVLANPDAIYLSSAQDVLAFAQNCRLNTWSIGKTIILSNDIDMNGVEFSGIPTFGGNFVGQGYTITGIELTEDGSVLEFFRYLQETAVVENVTIEGMVAPEGSKSKVGGIAGKS